VKSFLLGYYAHLITDAEFQRYIRYEKRVTDFLKGYIYGGVLCLERRYETGYVEGKSLGDSL
jgi:hypothetical protein